MQMAVFDLDSTVWHPEMYQISGPPQLVPLESRMMRETQSNGSSTPLKTSPTILSGMIATDRKGVPVEEHKVRQIKSCYFNYT